MNAHGHRGSVSSSSFTATPRDDEGSEGSEDGGDGGTGCGGGGGGVVLGPLFDVLEGLPNLMCVKVTPSLP